ncbi:MAG: hypothetical protein ACRCV3_02075 [Desulfovibrionaceae bacterium]
MFEEIIQRLFLQNRNIRHSRSNPIFSKADKVATFFGNLHTAPNLQQNVSHKESNSDVIIYNVDQSGFEGIVDRNEVPVSGILGSLANQQVAIVSWGSSENTYNKFSIYDLTTKAKISARREDSSLIGSATLRFHRSRIPGNITENIDPLSGRKSYTFEIDTPKHLPPAQVQKAVVSSSSTSVAKPVAVRVTKYLSATKHGISRGTKETVFTATPSIARNILPEQSQRVFFRQEVKNYSYQGHSYTGQWVYNDMPNRGFPHGNGVMMFKTGSQYEGSFKNGKRHGVGKHIQHSTGLTFEGTWKNDKLDGVCRVTNRETSAVTSIIYKDGVPDSNKKMS